MTQIPRSRSFQGRTDRQGKPCQAGQWMGTLDARRDLKRLAEAGCEAYGVGPHWVEAKRTPSLRRDAVL